MSLPTLEAAFAPGGAVFKWPDSTEVIASAARFNAINSALFSFIKQLEEETGFSLASHNARITSAANMLETHAAAIADRYTKAEADAVTDALGDAVTAIDTALQSLTAIVQTDTEAANALAALSAQWDAASNDLKSQITGWLNERYTKSEVQTLLSSKADKASVPTNQDLSDALAAKANTQHNHTLTVGDGSFERFTLGTQERLNIKAGTGLKAAFNATQKTVELSADVQPDIDTAIESLKGGVTSDGNTLAKLRSMIGAIQTALQSDDASLDTIQELVSRIKADADLLASLTTAKVSVVDIVDALTSSAADKPLSANQGKALKSLIDALGTASTKNVPTSGNATAAQVVLGSDTRLTDARPASDVSAWAKAATKPAYTAAEVGAAVQADITAAVSTLKGNVPASGDTLAKLYGLIAAIQTVLQSDDALLDTLQEVITRIKTDGDLITSLTSGKVDKATVIELGGDLSGSANLSAAKNTITAKIAAKVWDANK